jgi:hypothetical protein
MKSRQKRREKQAAYIEGRERHENILESLKKTDFMEHIGRDGRIILKCILQK